MARDQEIQGSIAPLKNVALMLTLANKLIERPSHLDRLGAFYGPSGYGKSSAAQYLQNRLDARIVTVFHTSTRLTLLRDILLELGVAERRGNANALQHRAIEVLARPGHPPLLIDEADKAVDKGFIEVIREIQMMSKAPIIMIGEEALEKKLGLVDRAHSRVSAWALAQPTDLEDAQLLVRLYSPAWLTIEPELVAKIHRAAGGSARRISNSIENVVEWARVRGVKSAPASDYDGEIDSGSVPQRSHTGAEISRAAGTRALVRSVA